MASNKQKNQLWASIDSIETAKQVARQSVWAAVLVAVVTAIFAIVSVALGGSLPQGMPAIDAWSFWDAGIFVAIAWGIQDVALCRCCRTGSLHSRAGCYAGQQSF